MNAPKPLDVLIYRPGAMLPEPRTVQLGIEPPPFREIDRVIRPLIGCDNIEHVSVLFRGERADMFVDEMGACRLTTREPLPVNQAATLIYHEASRRRGADMTDAPKIHGTAVVTLRRVWF